MRTLDLFSGIGGFSLAASWAWGDDLDIVSFCEIDPFCRKVLKKHWPDVPCHDDIKTLKGDSFGTIDLISAGVPCQPASCAGKRKGKTDDRWLWGEAFRIIKEALPRWVILENVRGLLTLEKGLVFDSLLSELENYGYETTAFIIPACAVGAPHRRDRIWIVANRIEPGTGDKNREIANQGRRTSQDRTESLRQTLRETCTGGIISTTCHATDPGRIRQAEHEEQTEGGEQYNSDVADASSIRCQGRSEREYSREKESRWMQKFSSGNTNQ